MEIKNAWEWIKGNKLMAALAVFFVVVISYWALNAIWTATMMGQKEMLLYEESEYYYPTRDFDSGVEMGMSPQSFGESELEIRSGRIEVESEDSENDLETLKDLVNASEGYMEKSSKYESNLILRISAQIRIPVEEFDSFVEELEKNFEIESFELQNYRVDVQQQLDELTVIRQVLADYDQMREDAQELDLSVERVELLASLTREMRELAREQDRLERDLGGKTKQADLATLNVDFVEELDIELNIWPDDLRNRLVDNLNAAMDSIATTLTSILTNSVVIFVKIIEYLIYAFVVLIPVMFAWNLVKRRRNK